MAKWAVEQIWKGEDVYIIGGGPSLKGFDWKRLVSVNTIGCNQAYELGAEVCDFCFFGDIKFFEYNKLLPKFTAYSEDAFFVTSFAGLYSTPVPWLLTLKRLVRGLSTDPQTLGWNSNSGAAAINLALLMGASRVFLLGFDNTDQNGDNNWHDKSVFDFHPSVHAKHREGLELVAEQAAEKFPEADIYNLNEESGLACFEKRPLDEFLPLA